MQVANKAFSTLRADVTSCLIKAAVILRKLIYLTHQISQIKRNKGQMTIFKKAESIVARKIADELLLVPIQGKLANMERVFTLNEVGEFIWNELDGNSNITAIAKKIADEYDIDIERAEADCNELLEKMLNAGVIAVETGHAQSVQQEE
jgi:hypothetical protein